MISDGFVGDRSGGKGNRLWASGCWISDWKSLNSKMLNRSVFLPILLFIYFCLAAPHKREFKILSFLSEFHYLGLEKKLNDVSLNMIEILNFRFLILNP